MVTSKIIRANKKTLVNSIDIDTKKRKLSTREKVINALKSHKRGLPLMEIADKANVSSGGNIHQTVKFMMKSKEVIKESCPHCNATDLYKLNI
tara:strand:- start:7067 stop:7345 length:279 start_codon:yes stop_codon:yes gene_type:complete